jgi:hypothetical protein
MSRTTALRGNRQPLRSSYGRLASAAGPRQPTASGIGAVRGDKTDGSVVLLNDAQHG